MIKTPCFKTPKYQTRETKLRQGNVFTPVWLSVHRGVSWCHFLLWTAPRLRRLPVPTATLQEITSLPTSTAQPLRSTSGRYASYWKCLLVLEWVPCAVSCSVSFRQHNWGSVQIHTFPLYPIHYKSCFHKNYYTHPQKIQLFEHGKMSLIQLKPLGDSNNRFSS